MKTQEIIIFIIIILIVAVGTYFIGMKHGEKKVEQDYKALMEKAGAAPVVNPMENLPSANPFEDVNVNPFEGGYQNPFK